MTEECIILAGGLGTRLGRITKKIPKPLIEVNNKPFILYIIENLYRQGIRKFYILTWYKNQFFLKKIPKKFKNSKIFIIKEKNKLGTAGCIVNILDKLGKSFFVVNGDTFFDINIRDLEKKTNDNTSKIGIGLKYSLTHKDYKSYQIKNNLVTGYNKNNKKNKLVCGGIYYFKKNVFDRLKKRNLDIDHDIVSQYTKKNRKITAVIYNKDFIDIGTYYFLKKAKKFIEKKNYRPAAFLDRDGVINHDYEYVHMQKNFVWKKNIFKAIKLLNDSGFRVFIITNQAGIANGFYSEKKFKILNSWMLKQFMKHGSFIDQVYYCPYHPIAKIKKYRKKTNMRKPGNGMIIRAFNDWKIKRKGSFLIGDTSADIEAGKKSNLKSYFVKSNIYSQIARIISQNTV